MTTQKNQFGLLLCFIWHWRMFRHWLMVRLFAACLFLCFSHTKTIRNKVNREFRWNRLRLQQLNQTPSHSMKSLYSNIFYQSILYFISFNGTAYSMWFVGFFSFTSILAEALRIIWQYFYCVFHCHICFICLQLERKIEFIKKMKSVNRIVHHSISTYFWMHFEDG